MSAAQKRTPGAVGTGRALRGTMSVDSELIVRAEDFARKRLTNVTVQSAMKGRVVHPLASEGSIVIASKWPGMCRECLDVPALAACAKQEGAAR